MHFMESANPEAWCRFSALVLGSSGAGHEGQMRVNLEKGE
jgi:hypothetical protein